MADAPIHYQLAIPLVALAIGVSCHLGYKQLGKLLIYFGAQTSMNLYVKSVLNKTEIGEGLRGIPASFFVTLSQQIMSAVLFVLLVGFLKYIGNDYEPKKLTTRMDYVAVVCFGMSFAMNIGLNNFSLSLIPLSINLVIRACLPLSTLMSQQLLGPLFGEKRKPINPMELLCMIIGVGCACVTVFCDAQQPSVESTFFVGCLSAVGSLFSGAINLVLAGLLGTSLKMNPLDTTGFMSVPSTLFLLPITCFMVHPISASWKRDRFPSPATDWQVIQKVMETNPSAMWSVILFGPIAFSYNLLQWKLVHTLSATTTAFAGNMNKAATIMLSLGLGFESLPEGEWGAIKLIATTGNILAFTAYSVLKTMGEQNTDTAQPPAGRPATSMSGRPAGSMSGSVSREVELSFAASEAMTDTFTDVQEKRDSLRSTLRAS